MSLVRVMRHFVAQMAYASIKAFVPVKKGRVFCESFGGLQYSCNPKYITEAILEKYPNDFQIIWSFQNPERIKELDETIIKVRKWSFKEFYYIATSEFIISNIRVNNYGWGWKKRIGQKYIMTWHGSMALKRVEFDAEDKLPSSYTTQALKDSKNIDLMLSDSVWCTNFMRRAFKYDGEILDKGLPRNDIFLQPDQITLVRNKVRKYFSLKDEEKVLLYAPTFRADKSIDNYIFNWDRIISALESRWPSTFKIIIRLHPNMMNTVDTSPMMTSRSCLDVTRYPDMQELLCAADVLITDYSSSMFEFAIKKGPCFLFAPDADSYDRGFYFRLDELPFPVSKDMNTLVEQICSFDALKYEVELRHLFDKVFKYSQMPDSSSRIVKWMKVKRQE